MTLPGDFRSGKPYKAISILLITLIVVGSLAAYIMSGNGEENDKEPRPIAVAVEEVRIGSLSRKITLTGNLIANQTVLIRPEVSGSIAKSHVRGGEVVRSGDTLFELDDRQIRAELKEAEARLNFQKVEFQRADTLARQKFGSQQKLDEARSKLLMAEASVENLSVKLERTILKAPFTGLVSIHNLSIGTVVSPDKEIATFFDISPMQVEFRVPAQYLKFINVGQRVDVFIDGYTGDKPTSGIISNIDARVDPNAHSAIVRALIPNKQAMLRPGFFARVELTVGSKDNTMIISSNSIMNNEGVDQVYKIYEGLTVRTDVRTGIRDGDSVEILAGVAPGDHVVSEGLSKIRDRYPVRYTLNGVDYAFDRKKFEEKVAGAQKSPEKKEDAKEGDTSSAESPSPSTNGSPDAANEGENASNASGVTKAESDEPSQGTPSVTDETANGADASSSSESKEETSNTDNNG